MTSSDSADSDGETAPLLPGEQGTVRPRSDVLFALGVLGYVGGLMIPLVLLALAVYAAVRMWPSLLGIGQQLVGLVLAARDHPFEVFIAVGALSLAIVIIQPALSREL